MSNAGYCSECAGVLSQPKITDEYLMDFLDVDRITLKRFQDIQKAGIEEAGRSGRRDAKIKAIGISGSARDKFDTAAEDSNSEFLLKECMKELDHLGAETEVIPLRKYDIKPCKACYSTANTQCHFYCSCYPKGTAAGDDMSNILYDKVLEADIIIFATPVNNFKISSYMALFLDRCISLDGSLQPADPEDPKNRELNIKHMKFIMLTADDNVPGSGFIRRFIGKTTGIISTGHEEGTSMAISSLFMTLNHYGVIFPPWSNMYAMSSIDYPTFRDRDFVTGGQFIDDAKKIAQNAMKAATVTRGLGRFEWKYDYSSN